jgi:hypothetical protein
MAGCQIPHTEGRGEPLCLLLLEVSGVPRNCRQACIELLPAECEFIFPSFVTMELVRAQAKPDHKKESLRRCESAVPSKPGNSIRRYGLSKYDCSTAAFGVQEIVDRTLRQCC